MSDDFSPANQGRVQQFVEQWKGGAQPAIESFLADLPDAERRGLFAQLLHAEVACRREAGEEPQPADYLKRFPENRTTINAALGATISTAPPTSSVSKSDVTDPNLFVGEKIGKYEITSVLGRGGMGIVFGAFDTLIRREVAIKRLTPKLLHDDTALTRLLQEARTAGSLQHSNIVGIYDVLEEDGAYYIVMEKVSGAPLDEVLAATDDGRMEWKAATRIVRDCCEALAAAHEQGLIHRDIKPQNIMVTSTGRAKLLDFGLAKAEQNENTAITKAGTILGTPDFMSPEQFSAESVDSRSDLYSLGATYFALLTGHAPYSNVGNHVKVMYAHCNSPVPNASDEVPDLPADCDAVIHRAMAKSQADRFQSAAEMKAALQAILGEDSQTLSGIRSATMAAPAASRKKPIKIPLIAAGLCLLAALAAGGIYLASAPNEKKDPVADKPTAMGPGVTADTIILGTSTAYSGPNRELGRNMVLGIKTYFSHINDGGGIHGRKLELVVLDDGYSPDKALANMQELFEKRNAFAVIGNVGTPTARLTVPYASEHKHLFFAPFTGADLLRNDPPDRYVFNYRASYAEETAAMVRYFVELRGIAPGKIAVFAQSDSYGDDGFKGVVKAMRSHGIREDDILRVGYERNSVDIEDAVTQIQEAGDAVAAIIMVPTYKVAARFVKRIKEQRPEMLFGSVSFVGSEALAEEFRDIGPEYGKGVIVTQVVPHYESNATGVIRYRELLTKYHPENLPGFVSLEGFIAAECLVEGLRRAGPELTTENLIDALESIDDLDLGIGPIIRFGPSRHQASTKVWATMLTEEGESTNVDLD